MKLLIVEDEKIIRDHLVSEIDWKSCGIDFCSSAANGAEAVSAAASDPPDIILTDIRIPVMDGLAFLDWATEHLPSALVIMLTAYEDFGYVQNALRKGAFDYILKSSPTSELINAVLRARDKLDSAIKVPEEEIAASSGKIRKAIKWMKENINLDLSLQKVAEVIKANPSYLSALFKNETGMGFREYTLEIKIEKTRELLRNPDIRIKDIANLVGYMDDKYLTYLFKKQTGMTPSQYRRSLKIQNNSPSFKKNST